MSYRQRHIYPKVRSLRHEKKFYQRTVFWIVFLLFLAIGSFVYGIVWYDKFQVKTIEVSGNIKSSIQDIQALAFEGIETKLAGVSSQSIFLASKKRITGALLDSLPGVEAVMLQKKFPDAISITVKERQPASVFCESQQCFYLDGNGIIFEKLDQLPQGFFIMRQSDEKKATLGQKAVDATTIAMSLKIAKNLQDNFQINITGVLVASPLVITTSEGWKLYFNPAEDIDMQIAKMIALLAQEISPARRKDLQYIFLQYKDRAYYK